MEHLIRGEKNWHQKVNDNTDEMVASLDNIAQENIIFKQMHNRIYQGVDLSVKFASEIATAPYNGNAWLWIQARIRAVNFDGILVGDYIPLTLTDGKVFLMEVAGIETYYRSANVSVPHHIDFISRTCHPDVIPFNQVNYNNGTSVSPSPWLASRAYAQLNSLAMDVPSTATANPTMVPVDYRTTGILDKIPSSIAGLIINKHLSAAFRYTSGALLTDDNSSGWQDLGKLWLPTEVEVTGHSAHGSKNSFAFGNSVQYPIFAFSWRKRIKGSHWWAFASTGGASTNVVSINDNGSAYYFSASATNTRVPICFRIA